MLEGEYASFTNQSQFTHREKYFSGFERQMSFVALEEYCQMRKNTPADHPGYLNAVEMCVESL